MISLFHSRELTKKQITLKFCILVMLYSGFFGSIAILMVAYFQSINLSPTISGIAVASNTLAAFFGQIFWGYLSDRFNTSKKVFLITCLLSLFSYAMMLSVRNQWIIVIIAGFLGFVLTPAMTLLDVWILKHYYDSPHEYGKIRSFGCFTSAIYLLLLSFLVEKFSFSATLILASIFFLFIFIAAFGVSDSTNILSNSEKPSGNLFKKLLCNRMFVFIIIVSFLLGMGYAPVINMLPYTISNIGGTVVTLGVVYCLTSLAEAFSMLVLQKKLHCHINNKLFISVIFFLACSVSLALGKNVLIVTIGMIFKGLGYGLMLPTVRQMVYNNSPVELRTTSQSLCDAVFCSAAGVLSSLYSGVVIELSGGVSTLFGLCTVFFILSGILAITKLHLFSQK